MSSAPENRKPLPVSEAGKGFQERSTEIPRYSNQAEVQGLEELGP